MEAQLYENTGYFSKRETESLPDFKIKFRVVLRISEF